MTEPRTLAATVATGQQPPSGTLNAGATETPDAALTVHEALNRAYLVHKGGDPTSALPLYQAIVGQHPHELEARRYMAECLSDLGRYDEAYQAARYALTAEPSHAQTHFLLGAIESLRGNREESRRHMARALDLAPGMPGLMWNTALWLLQHGEYKDGWAAYEWGRVDHHRPLRHIKPQWDGKHLGPQKTLYVWAEQGLGDTLAFLRFLAMAKERSGARVVLEVQEQLGLLLHDYPVVDDVFVRPRDGSFAVRDWDEHISLLSLPFALGVESAGDIPAEPYLTTNIKANLPDTRDYKVGVCWQGGRGAKHQPNRSLSPAELQGLLGVPGVTYYSLQYQGGPVDGMTDTGITDFTQTAALINAVDLVVTVDTSVAHLAGAMGKDALVLLPRIAYYLWGTEDLRTHWYPSLTLLRLTVAGDWSRRIAEAREVIAAAAYRPTTAIEGTVAHPRWEGTDA